MTYPSCYVFCKWSFSRLLKSWPLVCVMASVKHNNKGRGWTLSPLRFCLIMCETALQFVVINQEQLEQQRALNVSQNCHLTSTMSRLNMGQRGKHQGFFFGALFKQAKRYITARKEVGFCSENLKRVRGNWIYSFFYLFIQVANCRLIQWILKFFILSLLLRFISCLNVLLFNFFLFKGHWIIFWREPNIWLSK